MLTKNFNHPIHAYRAAQLLVKRAIAGMQPTSVFQQQPPQLNKNLDYHFTFELQPRQQWNIVFWGLCCFSCDGEIIFAQKGELPVSLWRYRRQGASRTLLLLESTIRQAFRRASIPLNTDCPFTRSDDGVYTANINWWLYQKSIE